MRILIVALSVICLCIGQLVCAQPGKPGLTVILKDGTLKEFITRIEKQGDYSFNIKASLYAKAKPITVQLVNASLQRVMEEGMKDQPFEYNIINDKIIVIRLKESPAALWPTYRALIQNEAGKPVEGAEVLVKGSSQKTYSDSNGVFTLDAVRHSATLVITGGDIYTAELKLAAQADSVIMVYAKKHQLGSVTVTTMNNGMGYIPVVMQTGSWWRVSEHDLERNPSFSVMGRIKGRFSGLLDNSYSLPAITPFVNIRGLNSIDGNVEPMVIIDNVVQYADIMQIPLNPNDVESITVLKDAAAAMWGIRGGNGVIVITTRNGHKNRKPRVQVFQSLSWRQKPDLRYAPSIGIDNYIDIEESLFRHGFYNERINNQGKPFLTPVQEILLLERNGTIQSEQARAMINEQRKTDAVTDLEKYFYQTAIARQFHMSLDGGGEKYTWYMGAGLDANDGNLKGSGYRRSSMRMNIVSTPFNGLTVTASAGFIQEKEINQVAHPRVGYPYADLVNDSGKALIVMNDLRQGYKDTVVKGSLQDWNYRPWDDLRNANKMVIRTSLNGGLGIGYNISNQLSAGLSYQYNLQRYEATDLQNLNMYATRHTINRFMQLQAGVYTPRVPVGAMSDQNNILSIGQNFRSNIDYNKVWAGSKTAFIGTAGVEYRSLHTSSSLRTAYGVTADRPEGVVLDYEKLYPLFGSLNGVGFIPGNNSSATIKDHFISYFLNTAFTHKNRYVANVGVRYERARIVGGDTSYRDAPFVSGGIMWDISKEDFFSVPFVRSLKLRFTAGANGNNDKSVSAYTAIGNTGLGMYRIGRDNPPLRWERVRMINIGLNLLTKGEHVSLYLDYYWKHASELSDADPDNPSVPVSPLTSNVATMKNHGLDMTLNTYHRIGKLDLRSELVFSYAANRLVDYRKQERRLWELLESKLPVLQKGRPLFSIYALKWAGLDPQTGDPRGYYKGIVSDDYAGIMNGTDQAELVYKGPAQPTWFGTLFQELVWKNVSVSFSVSWKMGHYYRRNVMTYYDFYNYASSGDEEFKDRWQKPGDEKWTNVPSMQFPSLKLANRDRFYRYSEAAVEKADHIRWQDVCLSYRLNKNNLGWLPCHSVQLYAIMNNLGLIWKKSKQPDDPDFFTSYPNPRSYMIGARFDFGGGKK